MGNSRSKLILGSVVGLLASLALATEFSNKVDASTVDVKYNDTLWEYSQEYNVSVSAILQANHTNLSSYLILPGDKVAIPDGKPTYSSIHIQSGQSEVQGPSSSQQPAQQAPVSVSKPAQPAQSQYHSTKNTAVNTGSKQQVKITFYDPAVLGAGTMPNGMYSGVAANLSIYPKGTVLRITLPDGSVVERVVNDTGTFAASNPYQLDLAWPNSSIPSYGTGVGYVEVVR